MTSFVKKLKLIKDKSSIVHQNKQSEVTINELPNENLLMILKYGLVEDVVSKERVSTRFGSNANNILAMKTKFTTYMFPSKILTYKVSENIFDGVIKTIKKMKLLKDVSSLNVDCWGKSRIRKLAAANQGLTVTHTSSCFDEQFCHLDYLDCVKELNPNYTGKGVQCIILYLDHVSLLRGKFPELHLVTRYADTNTTFNPNIGTIYAIHSQVPYQFRSHLKHLFLDMNSFKPRDLVDYKNIESVDLFFINLDSFTIGMISPYLVTSKLKKIKINGFQRFSKETKDLVSTLSTEKLSGLRHIIDNHPLIKLELFPSGYIKYPFQNKFVNDREVMRMVLYSPTNTIETLILPSITVKQQAIDFAQQFNCRDLIPDLLHRFKKVYKIIIECPPPEHDHDWINDIFTQFVLSNKHRTFRVICKSQEHGDVKMIF